MELSFCHTWTGDYIQGVEYYRLYGSNNSLKKLFAHGATLFNVTKLRSEIELIAKSNPKNILPAADKFQKKKIDRTTLPDCLQVEFDKLHPLIQTISHQHSRLDLIQNNEDRHTVATAIVNAVQERRNIFQRIDHYNATGNDLVKKETKKEFVPVVLSEDKELRKLQLKNELILKRSQRSKLKNKINRVADFNAVVVRIEEIEKELKQ